MVAEPGLRRIPEAGPAAPVAASGPCAPELSVAGLTKHFGDGRIVLDGIDLTVERGAAVAVIGANGSGKSTLLRCCLRLIEPDGGSIRLLGCEVTALRHRELRALRSRVGFVFQRHNLVGRLSALTNVVHGAQARHAGPRYWLQSLAPPAVRKEAMDCLDRVGLAHMARHRADRLSGGQSQRVAIARALMQRPRVVIADEPVASLDPTAGEEVMRLFVDLMRREGITVVFTSHNLRHAREYADRIVGLAGGRVAVEGPAHALPVAALQRLFDRDHGAA